MSRRGNDAFRRELLAQPFPKEWHEWLSKQMTHYAALSDAERARLHDLVRVMVAEKTWEGCDGLRVTEIMKLTVAAQAGLLLLGIEHDYFSRVLSVVLFPSEFELPAENWQERGTVISGQAIDYGSVFLSWKTVLTQATNPAGGQNLVIHEFAHQLDFLDGYTNGAPLLRDRNATERWQRVMQLSFQLLRRDLQKARKTFLGSYAATNPTEFFSVASEKFFCVPAKLRECHPDLFAVLAEYYHVDPLLWFDKRAQVNLPPIIPECDTTATAQPEFGSEFIDFACPYCQRPVSFPPKDAATLKECPNCFKAMIVPERAGARPKPLPFPIRTERLLLRDFQPVDAEELSCLSSDERVLRYMDWNPMSLQQTEEWIGSETADRFPLFSDHCLMAIEARESAKLIGLVSIWLVTETPDSAQFEILIHPEWQRKGYGTEAAGGVLAYAFEALHVRRIIAECDSRNIAALRLLSKAGFRKESECMQDRLLHGNWVDTCGFAILRMEYGKRNT